MGRRRDEIADLAHDFDKMAIRLEELVAARDRLLADVSHELRTPLARLNLAIGLARQDPAKLATSLDRISGEAAKLDEMVGELLTLAKLESGQAKGEDYFNFAEIVKAVVQDARYEAQGKGVDVQIDIEPADENFEWIALGSGKLISRAIENIVRNAVRYSSEGGKVRAVLRRDGATYNLKVTDEGPGIPDEAMAALFMPFGVSADGFGFGLGLAIAQRAVAVHGGSIAARNLKPKGLGDVGDLACRRTRLSIVARWPPLAAATSIAILQVRIAANSRLETAPACHQRGQVFLGNADAKIGATLCPSLPKLCPSLAPFPFFVSLL